VEATIARACLQSDTALAVQAKREIGKLWDDIEKAPYKILFNPSVAGPAVWRSVQVVRQVDQALATLRSSPDGRRRLLAVHGNRFITHVLLSCLPSGFSSKHQPLSTDEAKTVQDHTVKVFDEVLLRLNELYPDAYLASLFKNATKCQALKKKCSCPPQPAV
jgi:hypothetical protein